MIAASPYDMKPPRTLGDRLMSKGTVDEAERAYTQLIEFSAKEAAGYMELAVVREGQKHYDDALILWRDAQALSELEPTGYLGELRLLVTLRQFEKAQTLGETLKRKSWPSRFGDVAEQVRTALAGTTK